MTLDEAIKKTKVLSKNDKEVFYKISYIINQLEPEFRRLLFDIEFANRLTYLCKIKKQTIGGNALAFFLQDLLITDMVSTLFRLWDTGQNTNSLYTVTTWLNKNIDLKNFIINLYPCQNISQKQAQLVIQQLPHTHKHKLLQSIKRYRTGYIGHNLQIKSQEENLLLYGDILALGSIMLYSDLTLKYAENFINIVLGKILNLWNFSHRDSCHRALKELDKILASKSFILNSGIRKKPLHYDDESGIAKEMTEEIWAQLKLDQEIFL